MTLKKRGAIEMSVGTIVTIVLLMGVLVLGVFLIQRIFSSATGAIDQVDTEIQGEIQKLFANEDTALVVYPASRQITLKKGDDPRGFAFSFKNRGVESRDYTYNIEAEPTFKFSEKCGSSFTASQANSWPLTTSGSFSLGPGNSLELPELVLFDIPDTAPPCTIPFKVNIQNETGTSVFVTIK